MSDYEIPDELDEADYKKYDPYQLAYELGNKLNAATALVTQLRAEVAELRKDAERYQWLRKSLTDRSGTGVSHWFCSLPEGKPETLDCAIDAARAKEKEHG